MSIDIRPIPEFPDYGITRDGRLWRLTPTRFNADAPYEIKAQISGNGPYLTYVFVKNGRKVTRTIHRIVATEFCERKPGNNVVRHLNGNNLDPRAENLAWGTSKDNADDMLRHGRRLVGEKHGSAKINSRQALIVKRLYAAGFAGRDCAFIAGMPYSTARNIMSGQAWKCLA